MKKNLLHIFLIGLASLIILSLLIFVPVCDKLVELANGNTTFMKCHYTSRAAILLSAILIFLSLESIVKKTFNPLTIIAIALGLILVTIDGLGIGLCKNSEMACHISKNWIRVPAVLIILSALGLAFKNKKSI